MSKEGRNKVSLKKKVGHEEAVAILEDILKNFKSGNMVIQNGEDSLTLNPSGQISMEIKAKTKKLKNKLSMELSWKVEPIEVEDFNITESGPDDPEDETQEPKPDFGKARVIKKAE
ncbi:MULTISPECIES: amphi-Trp domain-containing protein [unclassified Maridesulfovibrio]|uniref:amphi-Trp domain-containing protein n=1 Tax=unclassified Maridesulfovibrio TaxID=2794999 RepID=UPI003B3E64E6